MPTHARRTDARRTRDRGDGQPFRLDANVTELQRRRRSRTVAFFATLIGSSVPGALVLLLPAFAAGQQSGPGFDWTQVLANATRAAEVYGGGRDPMTTVGALAAITVAVIFYNARVQLPLPAERGDHSELERQATVLITKSVLRFVATLMAVVSWLLIQTVAIRFLTGDATIADAVEGVALIALVVLSCNFATTQSEEIAQRSLLDVAHAVGAYTPRVAAAAAGDQPALRLRMIIAAFLAAPWLIVLIVVSLLDPALADGAEVVAQVVVAVVFTLLIPVAALLGGLLAVGAARVRWRRAAFRALVGLCGLIVVWAVAECLVGILLSAEEPGWVPFYVASLVLYVALTVLLLPLVALGHTLRARVLRRHLEEQAAQPHFEPYLDADG